VSIGTHCFCGRLRAAALRPGNVHSSDGRSNFLEPAVERCRERDLRHHFWGEVILALPDIYEFLEAKSYSYTIHLKSNAFLQHNTSYLLTLPVGRPPSPVVRTYANFSYQAGS